MRFASFSRTARVILLAAIAAPACGTLLPIDSSEPPVAGGAGAYDLRMDDVRIDW